jgi:cell division protein FtsL
LSDETWKVAALILSICGGIGISTWYNIVYTQAETTKAEARINKKVDKRDDQLSDSINKLSDKQDKMFDLIYDMNGELKRQGRMRENE